jgi:hypothetical protein
LTGNVVPLLSQVASIDLKAGNLSLQTLLLFSDPGLFRLEPASSLIDVTSLIGKFVSNVVELPRLFSQRRLLFGESFTLTLKLSEAGLKPRPLLGKPGTAVVQFLLSPCEFLFLLRKCLLPLGQLLTGRLERRVLF